MALISKKGAVRSEDEKCWDELVEQIWAGNVIPVIGDSFVVDNTTIVHELLDYLADDKGLRHNPKTFSELYYDEDFARYRADLYEEVTSLIRENQEGFQPTTILEKFLSIEQFPFVITTSVDYTVEETMKKIWSKRGRRVRPLVFRNNPDENDDISDIMDIKEPTVYYMFGKADNNREHSYVLTEEDMLSFCQSWLSENHPPLLSSVIGSKYLLFLGVNYPDWLIRFMWYSMRSNLRESGILIDNRELESSLVEFFQRVSIRTQNTPSLVVNEIMTRLADKKDEFNARRFDSVPEKVDFFISYSRRDSANAELLYNTLTAKGFNVWYDKKDIAVGRDWEPSIRRGIRTARRFIALMSENTVRESNEHHVYHTEWDIALAKRMNDMSFVIPIYLGAIDLNAAGSRIPDDLKHIHAVIWDKDTDAAKLSSELTNLL